MKRRHVDPDRVIFSRSEHAREPERFKRNNAVDFAQRTSGNLAFVRRGWERNADVHLVTELVTSLLGILVFPWSYAERQGFVTEAIESEDREPQLLSRLADEGWPSWIQDAHLEAAITLGRLAYHLRNALAHRRIEFSSDSREPADVTIRKAISASAALAQREIHVFTQGSYRNNTNVRPPTLTDANVGLEAATSYTHAAFKNDFESAQRAQFGRTGVSRGDKAFDVHENTYRIDADVVATVERRCYVARPEGSWYYLSGTALRPDSGARGLAPTGRRWTSSRR